MLTVLREFFMADEVPRGDKAAFAFFELIALACASEGIRRVLDGRPLWEIIVVWVLFLAFFLLGIKWPQIKAKIQPRLASSVDRIINDLRYLIGTGLLIFLYLIITEIIYVRAIRHDLDAYVIPRSISTEQ